MNFWLGRSVETRYSSIFGYRDFEVLHVVWLQANHDIMAQARNGIFNAVFCTFLSQGELS